MPEAKVWELVALSMNIEPQQVNAPHYLGERTFVEGEEFDDRLAVAYANVGKPNGLPYPYQHKSEDSKIAISAFVKWVPAHWKIPRELAKRASEGAPDGSVSGADPALVVPGISTKSTNSAPKRKRSTPQSERAQRAIAQLYPNGVPDPVDLPNSLLCRAVSERIKEQEKGRSGPKLRDVSDDVIERAAARRK